MNVAYEKGLHELGDGLYAYLQPTGGWGWSNAGLITAGGTSLLVDTLFDLRLTREMLGAMRSITERNPIDAAMNTHGNGDHCYGNQLLPAEARLYATAGAKRVMQEAPPQLLDALVSNADSLGPELGGFVRKIFGPFEFAGVELRLPEHEFAGRLDLRVGDRAV
jgi:glyoxylase-like metal-dependent hydrolase (beta-lactamase superfamily II)